MNNRSGESPAAPGRAEQRVGSRTDDPDGERRWKELALLAADWCWELGPDLRFTASAGRLAAMAAVPTDGSAGPSFADLARRHGPDSPEWNALLADLAARAPVLRAVLPWADERPDGERVVLLEGRICHDEQGTFAGYRGIGRDVTEERKVETRLRREAELHAAVVQQAGVGLCVCHDVPEYPFVRFTLWNERMEELTGYSLEEINARGWYQSLYPDPEVRERAVERMERMRAGEDLIAEPWEITRKDGQRRTIAMTTTVMPHVAHGPVPVLALMQDITEGERLHRAISDITRRTSRHTGNELFASLAEHLVSVLGGGAAIVAERVPGQDARIRILCAHHAGRGRLPAFECDTCGTPCAEVLRGRECVFPERVQECFPADDGLRQYGASSYAGVPLRAADGQVIGLLALLFRGPIEQRTLVRTILRVFAMRAAAELERLRSEAALRASEARFERAVLGTGVGIWDWDLDTDEVYFAPAFRTLLGYAPDDPAFDGFVFREALHPADRERAIAAVRASIEHGRPFDVEYRLRRKDGSYVWVHGRGRTFPGPSGKVRHFAGAITDISGRRATEERLRQAATVFENVQEALMITDAKRRIIAVNPAFTAITGYAEDEVRARTPEFLHSIHEDAALHERIWEILQATGEWRGEVRARRKSGEVFPAWFTINAVHDEHGEASHYVAVFTDITNVKRFEEQLTHLAHHDPLTGLPNRLLLNARLTHAIERARRERTLLAVLFLDLDHFKRINDSLGHPTGDALLRAVARRLRATLREEDTVARLGGDEFIVLLEGLREAPAAGRTAEKILRCIAEPFDIDGHGLRVTVSVGISLFPRDGGDPETLLRNADAAMYRAKDEGRDGYQLYTSTLTASAFQRIEIENGMRRALAERGRTGIAHRRELVLHYQPQVTLDTGDLVGMEALVRMHDAKLGTILPSQLIPIAEETGLIAELGAWVLREACRQAAEWRASQESTCTIAVNVSGEQIHRPGLVEAVTAALEDSGLPAECLELEITESFLVRNVEQSIEVLDRLRAVGVLLTIDDFGTGYSSLTYLKRLPVHRLKIDRSFVRDVPHDPNDEAIVRAVLGLGRALQLTVVAEGVESEEQAAFLRAAGCELAQGLLFAPPLPADEASDWIAGRRATPGT